MCKDGNVIHVVGARPNFMKAAPVFAALSIRGIRQKLIHTGQHYDCNMSTIFFEQLDMPVPDFNLNVGSGSHARQTGAVMIGLESLLPDLAPSLVLVYGDVNSTMAAALVCAKLLIPLGHVEAGLRSGDRTMPEEINRIVTDCLADILFTPSPDGDENLLREGVIPEKIHRVGNVMIDTLVRLLPMARMPNVGAEKPFVLVTLHRPANVDNATHLVEILDTLNKIASHTAVLFPIHPRTRRCIEKNDLDVGCIRLLEPLGYLEFLALLREAAVVVTDSGGIQEETTYLGVPCLTLRNNTERPVTCMIGTNQLLGAGTSQLEAEVNAVLKGSGKRGRIPDLWDGRTAERIADVVVHFLNRS